jgi:hypothetical protein
MKSKRRRKTEIKSKLKTLKYCFLTFQHNWAHSVLCSKWVAPSASAFTSRYCRTDLSSRSTFWVNFSLEFLSMNSYSLFIYDHQGSDLPFRLVCFN